MSRPRPVPEAEAKAAALVGALKDQSFAEQLKQNNWPADTCKTCKALGWDIEKGYNAACCQRWAHHHLDCCLHCGNDERDPRTWGFRGKQ